MIENKLKVLQILEEIPTELNTLVSFENTTTEHSPLLSALRNILLILLNNSNYSQILAHLSNLPNLNLDEISEFSLEVEIILMNSILKTYLCWCSFSYTNFGNYKENNYQNGNQNNHENYDMNNNYIGEVYQSDCLISLRFMVMNGSDINNGNTSTPFQSLMNVLKYSIEMLKSMRDSKPLIISKNKKYFIEINGIVVLCLNIFNELLLISSPGIDGLQVSGDFGVPGVGGKGVGDGVGVGMAQAVHDVSCVIIDTWDFVLFVDVIGGGTRGLSKEGGVLHKNEGKNCRHFFEFKLFCHLFIY